MASEFSREQYSHAYPDGVENHWWNRSRCWLILKLLHRFCGQSPLVVDVGCGRGLEVQALRAAGVITHGVELAAVQPVANVAAWVTTGTDASDLDPELRAQANVLLLLDVLEHLEEPEAFLRQLLDHYPNVARIVVTVPARAELWSNYDEFYGHQCRYSLEGLKSLGSGAGLGCKAVGYFFQLLYPPARLLALLGKDRAIDIVPPTANKRWLHGVIARFFHAGHLLLPHQLRGSSAYAVFEVANTTAG